MFRPLFFRLGKQDNSNKVNVEKTTIFFVKLTGFCVFCLFCMKANVEYFDSVSVDKQISACVRIDLIQDFIREPPLKDNSSLRYGSDLFGGIRARWLNSPIVHLTTKLEC